MGRAGTLKADKACLMHKDTTGQHPTSFQDTVAAISRNCQSWLDQWAFMAFKSVYARKKMMRSFRCIVQTVIGLFIRPRLNKNKDIYIFEGLRNKEYMAAFSPKSVVVVGSHYEKKYAIAHGHGFCWSFPMQSAIHSNMSRSWTYPAIRQLKFWTKVLKKFDRVVFFVYEDTQPLGTFFIYLARLMPSTVRSVCIQHGYFSKYYFPIRNDGELSEINFVWKFSQADLIKCNKLKTFEIGLSYNALATPSDQLNVVLVGTGVKGIGTDTYERSIRTYIEISKILKNICGINAYYRPHPNEYNNAELLVELSENLFLVESRNKIDQLNGPKAIFVGVESSLLFEAGIAGHLVAHLKLDESIPEFEFQCQFEENKIADFIRWALEIKNNREYGLVSLNETQMMPLERFKRALQQAGLQ